MLVVISPAKKLNMTKNDAVEGSYPSFESETKELASYMKALSSDEISKLMGISANLAELSRDAMTVIHDQAEASRQAAVGVNLDEEVADLIRFQQAYQAAAQVIQMSQRMFDTLIQVS